MTPRNAIACPLCHNEEIKNFHKYDPFNLLYCPDCDLVYQSEISHLNQQALVNDIYDNNWVKMREQYLKNTFLEHAVFNTLLLDIFRADKGKLLEIGSGTGEFLYTAAAAGWEVTGIEASPTACSYALNKYGIELINGLWNKSLIPNDNKFDVIAFWHVLEHIAQPIKFLEEISSNLKPGGLIFFSVPNNNSFTNKICGYNSPLYLEKDHLFHYSVKSITKLVDEAELKILSLFSREEPNRLFQDLKVSRQNSDTNVTLSFEEMMALMTRLQGSFEGHELFCILTKS